jgi:putative ABC transport system permease protein
MWLSALDKKLLRELSQLKGQIATIALVLAGGIICFIALGGTYRSLEWARDANYDRFRFAHVFARLERAPESLARRIEAIPGVEVVQTRVMRQISVPLEGMERPAFGELVSLPANAQPATNALGLRTGRFPELGHDDEVVLLDSFAAIHGLNPGDRVPVVVNGKLRRLRIVGTAISPEYVYTIRPGQIVDDAARYAVLWMERTTLATLADLGGAFNEVTLRLEPGASEARVLARLDRLLAPFGGKGAIARKDQISNRVLAGELGQMGALASMIPIVFLGVAAFLINMVLARLIALQRPEIAVLKAIGYTNWEVAGHYTGLVLVVLLPGAALGVFGGVMLGRAVVGLYVSIFRFQDLAFRLSPSLVATSLCISGASALTGAVFAVRAAAKLPPAEAMRPAAPARYRKGMFERLGLAGIAGASGMIVVREIERRPLRTLLSSIGIAGAVGLIVFGHCGIDAMNYYLQAIFRREQRQDLSVTFFDPVEPRAASELSRMPGVITAEGMRTVPIRIRNGNVSRESALVALPKGATLRRLVGHGGNELALPDRGVLVTDALGDILGLREGDRPDIEILEGDRRIVRPVIAGFVDEAVGLQVYSTTDVAASLEHDLGAFSQVLLRIDEASRSRITERLRRSPKVLDVTDVAADMQRLHQMNSDAISIWTFVSVTLSALIVFGVIYNNARIALATRSRDLGSLRVLGMTRGQISTILLAGLAFEVAVAVPLGLLFGRIMAEVFFARAIDRETFRFPVRIDGKTYALAVVVALISALASALWVRRSVDRLDLIGVLKTRE